MPLLSICIPTYNRSQILSDTLSKLTQSDVFQNTNDVEIVISDNNSTDDTESVCMRFKEKFGDKIVYYKQPENIRDKNFAFVLGMARGTFAKLNNDTLTFRPHELDKFVAFLHDADVADMVFLPNSCWNGLEKPCVCNTFNDLLDKVSFYITWIGGLCVRTDVFKSLPNPNRCAHLMFAQVDIIARLMQSGGVAVIYPGLVMDVTLPQNKGGYSVPQVFGHNYMKIINEIYNRGEISRCVYNQHKKLLLRYHINNYTLYQGHNTNFSSRGYLKYLLPIYWADIYFYWDLLKYVIPKLFKIDNDSTGQYKEVTILFKKIRFRKRG